MSSEPIVESEMTFGPYPDGHFFYIEKSNLYAKIKEDVKVAEFLLIHPPDSSKVLIVEAKSSSPRPGSNSNFDNFIKEICDKLTNTLTLYAAVHLKMHSENAFDELPKQFQLLEVRKTKFQLILIIKGHQDSWLLPIHDALRRALIPVIKIWKLDPNYILVINDEMARSKKIIT